MPNVKSDHKQTPIPTDFEARGLNPRAYLSFPPREQSVEQEVHGLVEAVRLRLVPPKAAEQAFLNILARELDREFEAVKDALANRGLLLEGGPELGGGL